MEPLPKFEELTKEQQTQVRKVGRKFMLKSLLSSLNYGGLIIFSNLTLLLANHVVLHSIILLFLCSFAVNFTLFKFFCSALRENVDYTRLEIRKITGK